MPAYTIVLESSGDKTFCQIFLESNYSWDIAVFPKKNSRQWVYFRCMKYEEASIINQLLLNSREEAASLAAYDVITLLKEFNKC